MSLSSKEGNSTARSQEFIDKVKSDTGKHETDGKMTKSGGRRARKRTVAKKPSLTVDRKLFPDALSIPVVSKTGYDSALVRKSLSDTRILETPAKSFYLVDVQAIFELFLWCEKCITSNHRQGGWRHRGYYVSIFLRAFAARLQRVAIFTDLCTFNQREIVNQPGELPIMVAHIINQYGVTSDPSNVIIAPYVTFELVRFLLHMSHVLEVSTHVAHNDALDPDNWGSWIDLCYGEVCNFNVYLGCAFRSLGVPYTPAPTLPEISVNAAAAVNIYNTRQGVALTTGAQHVALLAVPSPLLINAVVGGGGNHLAPIGGVHNDVLCALDDQCDVFSSIADPFGGVALPPNSVAQYRTCVSTIDLEHEIMELRARYTVSLISLSPEGSFAPLVVGSDLDANCTASCVVANVSENEYFFGIIIDNTVILVGRDLLPFNFAAIARAKMRYQISALPFTRIEIVSKGMRECITRRKG